MRKDNEVFGKNGCRVEGIHHINIVVSDLKSAVDFFKALGFVVFEEKELFGDWIDEVVGLEGVRASYAALKIESSPVVIELLQYLNPIGDRCKSVSLPNTLGIRHIALKVNDIEAEVSKLKKLGVEFFSDIKTNPYGKKMCYLSGPDGIILELAEL